MGYSRRNAFVPVPTVTSFEAFNEWLWEWCEKDAQRLHYKYKIPIQELWEADRESLLKLPEYPFPVFRYEALSVNNIAGYCPGRSVHFPPPWTGRPRTEGHCRPARSHPAAVGPPSVPVLWTEPATAYDGLTGGVSHA